MLPVLRKIYFASQSFLTLNWPGIFYSTHAVRTDASCSSSWCSMIRNDPACMDRHYMDVEPACMHAVAASKQQLLLRACVRAR
jgi:hypothetical protein